MEEFWAARGYGQSSFEQTRAAVDSQFQQLHSDPSGRGERLRSLLRDVPTVNPSEMNQEPSRPPDISRQANRPFRRRVMRAARGTRPRETENNTLLDEPVPPLESPTVMPQEPETDRQAHRRRTKRRKLEADDAREGARGFSYGQYGQVVPGMLKMEVASCDGGAYDPDGESSFPDNILRNDSSVYCTKSDRCNLVLKHLGGAPFCLKRIVIKAPESRYDSPIQEGMVFVSMANDEHLTRTAQDQIQYSGARRRRRNRRGGLLPPSQEYFNTLRSPLQSLQRSLHASPEPHSNSDNAFAHQAVNPPETGFRVTTSHNDNVDSLGQDGFEDGDDDEPTSMAEMERQQMEHLEEEMACSDSDESDSDSAPELSAFSSRRHRSLQNQLRAMRQQYGSQLRGMQTRHHQVTNMVDPPTVPESSSSSQLLKPHSQFFIEHSQSMVNIKFDPPPYAPPLFLPIIITLRTLLTLNEYRSGRFILIKLWGPHNGGNIDIESIIAHGFAGPRFFPAGGFR